LRCDYAKLNHLINCFSKHKITPEIATSFLSSVNNYATMTKLFTTSAPVGTRSVTWNRKLLE